MCSRECLRHNRDYTIHLFIGKAYSAGNIEAAARQEFGHGVRFSFEETALLKNGLLVHWPKERARADPLFGQSAHGFNGLERYVATQDNPIDPINVLRIVVTAKGQL